MHGPPEWLQELADGVATRILAVDVLAPLGCHFTCADEVWEITLFASSTEILGGPQDGGERVSRFHVDILPLFELFDSLESVYWQAQGLGFEDDLGPHLGIEGVVQGQRVWVRIPSLPPRGYSPGRQALVKKRSWEELW